MQEDDSRKCLIPCCSKLEIGDGGHHGVGLPVRGKTIEAAKVSNLDSSLKIGLRFD
jgi:hypothetical protein